MKQLPAKKQFLGVGFYGWHRVKKCVAENNKKYNHGAKKTMEELRFTGMLFRNGHYPWNESLCGVCREVLTLERTVETRCCQTGYHIPCLVKHESMRCPSCLKPLFTPRVCEKHLNEEFAVCSE